jgi:hypothetical protein
MLVTNDCKDGNFAVGQSVSPWSLGNMAFGLWKCKQDGRKKGVHLEGARKTDETEREREMGNKERGRDREREK